MTVIQLPDREAAALTAKAAAQGLSLQAWLQKLAEDDAPPARLSPQEAAARMIDLQRHVKPDPEGWTVQDYINRDRP